MIEAATSGAAMYVFVALKAWQTRNVAQGQYWPVIPTSLLMALAEVYVISVIVQMGYYLPTVLAIGFGAGLGAMTAMYLHDRVYPNANKSETKKTGSSS